MEYHKYYVLLRPRSPHTCKILLSNKVRVIDENKMCNNIKLSGRGGALRWPPCDLLDLETVTVHVKQVRNCSRVFLSSCITFGNKFADKVLQ